MNRSGVFLSVHHEVIRARQAATMTAEKVAELRKIMIDPFSYPFEVIDETVTEIQTIYAELSDTQHDCEESVRYLIGQASAIMEQDQKALNDLKITAAFCIRQPLNDAAYIRLLGPDSCAYRFWNEVKNDPSEIHPRKVP